MTIGRRSFVWSMAVAGSVPALANSMIPPWSTSPYTVPPSGRLAQRSRDDRADVNGLVFKIDGWERPQIAELGDLQIMSTNGRSDAFANHQVWIGVNQAWRANWR